MTPVLNYPVIGHDLNIQSINHLVQILDRQYVFSWFNLPHILAIGYPFPIQRYHRKVNLQHHTYQLRIKRKCVLRIGPACRSDKAIGYL